MDDNGWTQALDFAQSALNSQTAYLNQQSYVEGEKEEAEKQRLWTDQMMDKQNAWSLQQWNMTNEYNSPSAQVQRLRDAGLNPLFYGLDGSSANSFQSAEPLGYERASLRGLTNPSVGLDASLRSAQVSSIELDNELKKKQLGWYDKEHGQEFDFKSASIDDIRQRIKESKSRIDNNEMDTKLKAKDIDKKDAEIATEIARCASIGLDNELKEQLNPLMVRAQDLENQLSEVRNQYEAERILAELAETRANTAALYARAALDGASKEGVQLDNLVKRAESKFADTNAQSKANLLKWTSDAQRYETSVLKNTWKSKVNIEQYYAEHYEEAFRNSWSQSGVEYGNKWKITEQVGKAFGTAALLGTFLAL